MDEKKQSTTEKKTEVKKSETFQEESEMVIVYLTFSTQFFHV